MRILAGFDLKPGDEIGRSAWKLISQTRINQFAEATDDFQFVHVDPARAAVESPFGGTVAHGFLTLSLLSTMAEEALPTSTEIKAAMVAAVDKVKFIAPVRADRRIRGLFHLVRMSWVGPDRLYVRIAAVIEIEDEAKPALTAELSFIFVVHDLDGATTPEGLAAA